MCSNLTIPFHNIRLLLSVVVLLPVFCNGALAAVNSIDRIVAIVNDDVITRTELTGTVAGIVRQLRESNTPLPPADVIRRQVLERLIVQRLQLQLAARTGLRVDDETLNDSLREIAKNNGLTLTQFRQVLESNGMGFGQFRENMRQEITISRLRRREVDSQIVVSDQEIDNFLEFQVTSSEGQRKEYQLSHILIVVPNAASPDVIQSASQKAQRVLQELRAGADFRETAIAVSDGQQALEGGDLGWRSLGQVPTIFVDEVRTMSTGDISEVIRSPSGFHIIKVTDTRGGERRITTQTKARHILITTNEMMTDFEAKIRLLQLKSRIEDGEDFSSLARAHSDDKTSAIKGGELGWTNPGEMVPEFEEILEVIDTGQVSQPFQSRFGWHILQVLDRRQYDSTDEFNRNQARDEIRKRKAEEDTELWLRELRDEAYVEYRVEETR